MDRHRLVAVSRAKQEALAVSDAGVSAAALLLSAHGGAPARVAGLVAAWMTLLYIMGLYDFAALRDGRALRRHLAVCLVAGAVLASAVMPRRAAAALAAAGAHAAFLLSRRAWLRALRSDWGAQGVAFLGDSALMRAMARDISARRHPGYVVTAWPAPVAMTHEGPTLARWRPAEPAAVLARRADVLVLAGALRAEERSFAPAFSLAASTRLPAIDELDFYEILYRKVPPRRAATPAWLMTHVLPRQRLLYPAVKRAVDAAAAAIGLLLAAPLLAVAAAVIAAEGERPFFRQRRVGLLGREFQIVKLRTMTRGAGPLCDRAQQAARLTRSGAFLRRFHLDELPQLWNVLVGDMSLVGPRPEWIDEARILERVVPCYHFRHLVKPGMTGWAQVNFRATNTPDDSVEKLRYDLYYLKHLSPALDAAILLRTAKRVFQRDEIFEARDADASRGVGLEPGWGGA